MLVDKSTEYGKRLLKEQAEKEDRFWDGQWLHEEEQHKHGSKGSW